MVWGEKAMNEDYEDIRNTPIFKKFLEDAPKAEMDLRDFNAKYQLFLNNDYSPVSVVLRCHLIVEHFIDEYLEAANPAIQNWEKVQLRFVQKLTMIDHKQSVIHLLIPGLKCLNNLRNKLAHQLNAAFNESDVAPISDIVIWWNNALRKPIPNGIEMIEAFSLQASGWLFAGTSLIKRHSSEHGLTGLFDWFRQ
jgi:hypothetical protein